MKDTITITLELKKKGLKNLIDSCVLSPDDEDAALEVLHKKMEDILGAGTVEFSG